MRCTPQSPSWLSGAKQMWSRYMVTDKTHNPLHKQYVLPRYFLSCFPTRFLVAMSVMDLFHSTYQMSTSMLTSESYRCTGWSWLSASLHAANILRRVITFYLLACLVGCHFLSSLAPRAVDRPTNPRSTNVKHLPPPSSSLQPRRRQIMMYTVYLCGVS